MEYAEFERAPVSRDAVFDRYRAGDANAISEEARQGWELFKGEAGCIRCHSGPHFSDGKFYRLGTTFTDKGRGAVTGVRRDYHAFRTPRLRDVVAVDPRPLRDDPTAPAFSFRAPSDGMASGPRGCHRVGPTPLTDASALTMLPLTVPFLRAQLARRLTFQGVCSHLHGRPETLGRFFRFFPRPKVAGQRLPPNAGPLLRPAPLPIIDVAGGGLPFCRLPRGGVSYGEVPPVDAV